jgi:hypothetical protein
MSEVMHMKTYLVLLLLVASMALVGCPAADDTTPEGTTTTSGSGDSNAEGASDTADN